MPAYVVLTREHTHDAQEMERYGEKAKAAREGHDPQPLAFMAILKYWKAAQWKERSFYASPTWLPPVPGIKAPPTRKPASTVSKVPTTAFYR